MAGEIQDYTEKVIDFLGFDQASYPDENKIYSLDFGKDLVVRYSDLHPGVNFMSILGKLPDKNREVLVSSLMHLNLFGNGTGGGVFGYSEENKSLTFTTAVPYRLQFGEFKNALEDFVNFVDFWKSELARAQTGEKSLLMTLN